MRVGGGGGVSLNHYSRGDLHSRKQTIQCVRYLDTIRVKIWRTIKFCCRNLYRDKLFSVFHFAIHACASYLEVCITTIYGCTPGTGKQQPNHTELSVVTGDKVKLEGSHYLRQ